MVGTQCRQMFLAHFERAPPCSRSRTGRPRRRWAGRAAPRRGVARPRRGQAERPRGRAVPASPTGRTPARPSSTRVGHREGRQRRRAIVRPRAVLRGVRGRLTRSRPRREGAREQGQGHREDGERATHGGDPVVGGRGGRQGLMSGERLAGSPGQGGGDGEGAAVVSRVALAGVRRALPAGLEPGGAVGQHDGHAASRRREKVSVRAAALPREVDRAERDARLASRRREQQRRRRCRRGRDPSTATRSRQVPWREPAGSSGRRCWSGGPGAWSRRRRAGGVQVGDVGDRGAGR